MTRAWFGSGVLALAALVTSATPTAAQLVQVRVVVGSGHVRAAAEYGRRPGYRSAARLYCEADGPYRYCWEPAHSAATPVVIHVYQPRAIGVGPRRGRALGQAKRHWKERQAARGRYAARAERAYWRWRGAQRDHWYGDRDRARVRIAVVWEP